MSCPRPGLGRTWAPALVAALLAPAALSAQARDLEVAARRSGVGLPQAYYDQLRRDPDAFSLPRPEAAWAFGRIQAGLAVSGELPVLVVPALFADSEEPRFSAREIRDALFDGPPGHTLTGFYREVSDGRLELTGTVAPWVRTSLTEAEVTGTSNGLGSDTRLGDYLVEALRLVDAGTDFGRFDNDGPDGTPNSGDDDGWIDALAFEFAEIAGSCGSSGIWPHLWGIAPRTGQPYESNDLRPDGTSVRADAYIIVSSTDCSGQNLHGPGVMAHEMGHILGLPDIYHRLPGDVGPSNRRWVVGCWGLMAAGTWGCEQGAPGPFGPTHLSAWSKLRLGWGSLVEVGTVLHQEYVLPPTVGSNRVLRIPLDQEGRESLLLEYRTQAGFDADLPASGVLVYHEDTAASMRPAPDAPREYRISLLEADGQGELLRIQAEGGNRGEAEDAFARDGADDALAGFSEPMLLTHGSGIPRVTIHSIAVGGSEARIRVSTVPVPVLVGAPRQATALTPYRESLTVAGGAPPYTVRSTDGSLPPGISWVLDRDSVVLSGSPGQAGTFELALAVDDTLVAQGDLTGRTDLRLTLEVTDVFLPEGRLLNRFFGGAGQGLTQEETRYLDRSGNDNGRYDVGDLRAYLRRTGAVP